ncbi:MAG: patatin-like phospholipase family protein, partial [Limisphaerales bacterium]
MATKEPEQQTTKVQLGKPSGHLWVLSLDGGGAKGFYTLGILKEIEALLGSPLSNHFDLIFGTSTGGIIAALLALGYPVDEILALYKKYVPQIMKCHTAAGKTAALATLSKEVFKKLDFAAFKTDIGIVATQWDFEKPKIFK